MDDTFQNNIGIKEVLDATFQNNIGIKDFLIYLKENDSYKLALDATFHRKGGTFIIKDTPHKKKEYP